MSNSKTSDFLDHSNNYVKDRLASHLGPKTDGRDRLADPYSHVGDGKPRPAKRDLSRDFSDVNLGGMFEDTPEPTVVKRPAVSMDHPLVDFYALLNRHGAVELGAQLADGSWEAFPLVLEPEPETEAEGSVSEESTKEDPNTTAEATSDEVAKEQAVDPDEAEKLTTGRQPLRPTRRGALVSPQDLSDEERARIASMLNKHLA